MNITNVIAPVTDFLPRKSCKITWQQELELRAVKLQHELELAKLLTVNFQHEKSWFQTIIRKSD